MEGVEPVCYSLSRLRKGIFYGDSPFANDTTLLFLQLSVCAAITAVLQRFLTPLGQGAFISQVLAGVILGPSFIGRSQAFSDVFFPMSNFNVVQTLALFGVMFYIFIVGVKTDLSVLQESGKRALAIGICGFFMPLVLNFMLAQILAHSILLEPKLYTSLPWIASFQAFSSFHVISCLLADLKLMNSELGRLAISSSLITGLCCWLFGLVVFTGKGGTHVKPQNRLLPLVFVAIIIFFAICIFRPLTLWMIKRTRSSVKESHICTVFIAILGCALFGEYFGQHFLFGPMILGIVVPDGPPLGSALVSKLELFISSIILPIYFVFSAARIDFSAISLRNLFIIGSLAVFATFWKVVGVMLPSVYYKMPVTDAFHLGLILSNQGIVEVLVLQRAQFVDLIDSQSYNIMVLLMVLFTGILAPTVKFLYKPSKRYTVFGPLNIQHGDPNAELRILACLHHQEETHSILNLFEASYPNHQSRILFYVVHLIELAGRSAPVLVAHYPGTKNSQHSNHSEHIVNALRFFEYENRAGATVYPITAISPYASMHEDVCTLAAENMVSLVIVLFHKHPAVVVSEVDANSIRSVNHNIIKESPCSVGILVDRTAVNLTGSISSRAEPYRIGLIFLGGPDDREALSYAGRMARHPNVSLTLIRFVDDDTGQAYSIDKERDSYIINEYMDAQMKNRQMFYQEEQVKDSMGVLAVVRGLGECFNLILTGRRHDGGSQLLAGLNEWNEYPELGCVGDMLMSTDSMSQVSILVVQQGLEEEEVNMGYPESVRQDQSSAVLDMPWSDSSRAAWPGSRPT